MNLQEIKNRLKEELKASRYEHTLGVADTAQTLAKKYNCDVFNARLAAFLHDCAKCMDETEQIRLCQKYGVVLTTTELNNHSLIHAKTGVVLAKEHYGVTDEDVLHAIAFHTTGCKDMSLLDKIIYVADYIEPGRDKAPRLEQLRKEAFENIDTALYHILEDTVSYLKESGKPIDAATYETYEYYRLRR